MKLGILTFHSQLNYGGVLQCWALKNALETIGHKVVIIDRWFDESNARLRRQFVQHGIKSWVKCCIKGLLGCGDFGSLLRTCRTERFVCELGLTPYHFVEWKDAPSELGVDCLVVGSDQVWHCGDWGDPRAYLLEDAPPVPAIAYAASFGMTELPEEFKCANGVTCRKTRDCYHDGLKRFKALSCREREGVKICRQLGFEATHVVDPSILVEPAAWLSFLGQSEVKKECKLVCYFMSVSIEEALPKLKAFAKRLNCQIEILADKSWVRSFPKSAHDLIANFNHGKVRVRRSAGPREFVAAFASATWVLTDSFHALMFSSIFNCNIRYLRPQSEMRQKMFARIIEFSEQAVRGPLILNTVSDALSSLESGEEVSFDESVISELRQNSRQWLENALKG